MPLTASLKVPPGLGLWIYDDRQVVTEIWHADLWLADADTLALYLRTWKTLRESAVYGADAHHVINAARRALNPRCQPAITGRAPSSRLATPRFER